MIESIRGVNCPHCRKPLYFTDSSEDLERHRNEYGESPIVYLPGVDVRGWTPTRELVVSGRTLRITRKDLLGNRVYPVRCPGCSTVYVARLDITNVPDVKHYEEAVRPYHPPSMDFPEVAPKWGFRGQTVADFCDDVRSTRNPMVRAFVARSLRAAGWDFVELRGLEQEFPFQ